MAAEPVTEIVAEGLEEAAEATRHINPVAVRYFSGGLAAGFAIGFFFGWRFTKEKIRAEAFAKSEEEVEQIRKAYHDRDKPDLAEVVEERGYSVEERPLQAPVPIQEEISRGSAPTHVTRYHGREQDREWDYAVEVPRRTKNHPYIIHQDEFKGRDNEYTQLTWTYWAADNILVDENDEVIARPELTVGEESLKRFGHGSDDTDVVFVRNDRMEIEWEICRTFKSYEVEVLGLDGPESETDDESPRE